MTKPRVQLYAVSLGAQLALFFAALAIPVDPVQKQSLLTGGTNVANSAVTGPPVVAMGTIFAHNASIAALEFIPIVGVGMLGFSMFSTGLVVQALAVSHDFSPLAVGATYLMVPFFIVEMSAYALATCEGCLMVWAFLRHRATREVRLFLYQGAIVIGMLGLAATMETVSIVRAGAALIFWVPLLFVGVAAFRKLRGRG
jgi:hypothetical protein